MSETETVGSAAPSAPSEPASTTTSSTQGNQVREKFLKNLAKSDDASDYIAERRDQDAEKKGDESVDKPRRVTERVERFKRAAERARAEYQPSEEAASYASEQPGDFSSEAPNRPAIDPHVAAKFDVRAQDFAKTVPDFDGAMSVFEYFPVNPSAVAYIGRSDVGPQIAYELANNLDAVEELNQMQPADQAYVIGRIESRILFEQQSAGQAQPQRRVPKAPPPMSVPRGGITPPQSLQALARKGDAGEYIAERNRQERARVGR